MIRAVGLFLATSMVLTACGGGAPSRVERLRGPAVPFASGPIANACLSSGRASASRSLCGCVQAVADQTLSGSDQALAVSFFADPHRSQEIRQSDRSSHRVFWDKYKHFARSSEAMCKGA